MYYFLNIFKIDIPKLGFDIRNLFEDILGGQGTIFLIIIFPLILIHSH